MGTRYVEYLRVGLLWLLLVIAGLMVLDAVAVYFLVHMSTVWPSYARQFGWLPNAGFFGGLLLIAAYAPLARRRAWPLIACGVLLLLGAALELPHTQSYFMWIWDFPPYEPMLSPRGDALVYGAMACILSGLMLAPRLPRSGRAAAWVSIVALWLLAAARCWYTLDPRGYALFAYDHGFELAGLLHRVMQRGPDALEPIVLGGFVWVLALVTLARRRLPVAGEKSLHVCCALCRTDQCVPGTGGRCCECDADLDPRSGDPRCPQCSYSLRGLPTTVCPECGRDCAVGANPEPIQSLAWVRTTLLLGALVLSALAALMIVALVFAYWGNEYPSWSMRAARSIDFALLAALGAHVAWACRRVRLLAVVGMVLSAVCVVYLPIAASMREALVRSVYMSSLLTPAPRYPMTTRGGDVLIYATFICCAGALLFVPRRRLVRRFVAPLTLAAIAALAAMESYHVLFSHYFLPSMSVGLASWHVALTVAAYAGILASLALGVLARPAPVLTAPVLHPSPQPP